MISDALKQTWVIQAVRSAAQWIGGWLLSLAVVALATDQLAVDPDQLQGGLRTVLEVLLFVVYIVTVNLLEKINPKFGWLNGWKTELQYDAAEPGS